VADSTLVFNTVDAMYPELKGSLRRDAIRRDWEIPSDVQAKKELKRRMLPIARDVNDVAIFPYDKIFEVHSQNMVRNYIDLIRAYADKFIEDGYTHEDTSPISVIATDTSCTRWKVFGGWHRTAAFFLVLEEKGVDNEFVKEFIGKGGFDVVLYKHDMPEMLVQHLVEELNSKNNLGAENTIMQKIAKVDAYSTAFATFNHSGGNDHALGSAAYKQDEWAYVKEATALYDSELEWKKAQVLYNALTSNKLANGTVLFDAVTEYFRQQDFGNARDHEGEELHEVY
jgi:hypothetical protein